MGTLSKEMIAFVGGATKDDLKEMASKDDLENLKNRTESLEKAVEMFRLLYPLTFVTLAGDPVTLTGEPISLGANNV